MSDYALAVTVHDPDRRLLERFSPGIEALVQEYGSLSASCSLATHEETKRSLREHGFVISECQDGLIGESRRTSLHGALADQGAKRIQYADLDRLLHWQYSYPGELREVLARPIECDYVALGRTPRALSTHPSVQILAETLTNAGFSAFLGLDTTVDVVAGSFLMSRRAATMLRQKSTEATNATDLEWPALVIRHLGVQPCYTEVEGLEFETADYYPDDVRELGSRDAWLRATFDRPGIWVQRARLALDSLEAFRRVMDESRP